MKSWPWLLLSVLNHMVPPAYSAPSPSTSRPGGVLQCADGHYMFTRNKIPTCFRCTPSCTGNKNLIEVAACTKTSDRHCLCEAGYFCPSPVSKTCRKDCIRCTDGFTSTPNLNISCQKFKKCARGEEVITKGSSTKDHVCGIPSRANHTTAPPDRTNTTTTQRLVSSNPKFHSSHLVSVQVSYQNPMTSLPWRSEASPGFFQAPTTRGPVPLLNANSKTTWILFLLLLIALCLVLCLSLKCKSSAIKCRLEQAGLVFRRYQPVHSSPNTDAPVPVSDVTDVRDQSQGQGSFPGKNQKVTMEHVGKSDGINNTVGSIFIYSPGMVILGSNSNEKKEEVFSGGEEEEEDVRLMSVPQQESSSEEVFIRLATQEELDKELSIPVPATSK